LLFTHCAAVKDSCGDGEFRGGFGIDHSFKATGEMTLTMHGDRAVVTPFGLAGGTNGGPNVLKLRRTADPTKEEDLGMYAMGITLRPGDHVIYQSNGGGGFGNPLDRDPARVLADVEEGWIAPEKAENTYGVVIIVDDARLGRYRVDTNATVAKRMLLAN